MNGYRQEGFARFDRNIRRGRRLSAARAYLHPVMRRAEPRRSDCRAHANRILFEGTRAVGVEYVEHGRTGRRARSSGSRPARSSAAAARSTRRSCSSCPASAMPRSWTPLGVPVVHDLPGVGEHMQDHLEVYIQHRCTQPVSMAPALRSGARPWIGLQWLFFRQGPGATNHFEAGGFVRSNDDVAYPNVMFHFLPIAIRYDGRRRPAVGHGYQVHVGPMYSNARGSVKITSTDPGTQPALRFNYLSTDEDRREWVETVRAARTILAQPAFAPFSGGEISPGAAVETDEEILDWVARDAETALHPSCTCRDGHRPAVRARPCEPARPRRRRPARGRCRVDALHHQREHLRPGHDARREGRRPDRRQHPAARGAGRLLPPRRLRAARARPAPASPDAPPPRPGPAPRFLARVRRTSETQPRQMASAGRSGGWRRRVRPGRRSSSARSAARGRSRRPPGPVR